jgi:long-chain acyl-CoA synthetase
MIASFVHGCQTTPDDTVMVSGSMSHIGSFLDCFMGLSAGARVVIPRSFDADGLLPMLRQHRPTIFVALPITLFGLIRDPRTMREDHASLRLCGAGGDKVPAELEREYKAMTGLSINEQYGMTEIGIATMSPSDGDVKVGSIGRAMKGYHLAVRGSNGSDLADSAEGRLWIKSRCNMIRYWESQEATDATIKDGWLDTGDVVKIDAEGYVWFCGRQKQMIIHEGSNISPQEIEDALLEHPAVAMAGVVGVHDLVHRENVRAFITLNLVSMLYHKQSLLASPARASATRRPGLEFVS